MSAGAGPSCRCGIVSADKSAPLSLCLNRNTAIVLIAQGSAALWCRAREGSSAGYGQGDFPTPLCTRAWTARRTPNPGLILRTERQRDVRSRSRSGRCSIAARGLLANAGDTREGRRRRGTSKGREEAAPGWGTSPTPLAFGLGRHPSPAGSYTEHRSSIRHARVGLRSGWRPIQTSRIWDAWARRGKRRSSAGLDKEIPNAALHMGLRPQGERSNPG